MNALLQTAAASLGLFAVHLLLTCGVAAQMPASAPGRACRNKGTTHAIWCSAELISSHITVNNALFAVSKKRNTSKQKRTSNACEAFLAEGERLSHTGTWGLNVESGDVLWSQGPLAWGEREEQTRTHS